ncbi:MULTISPECIES: hypothetical protein [Bacillaceae]|uniref:hypothetical protein n=1 Tax=Bacillaceae TaxID=186817 RepID=UPI001E3A9BF5|nr:MULTISPECIES: hypothetical protein [Bacillaceae]MCE4050556.1 hypothetical protein [Bacillus sp. Au-Bac7]MCM3034229.1 hypothetical protein [Niallia sp. MER 6]MDL0434499.1 hypothetical protein [Niallia sp. SS-2023]UPO88530.1 hypothetical protein L8T27_005020 [Niallia sp. Man26]
MNSIYKTHEELAENTELQHYILQTFGLQSKKKRVKKKLLKQLVSQENLINQVVQEFHHEGQGQAPAAELKASTQEVKEVKAQPAEAANAPAFSALPVTALLKIGKAFFKEEECVRYYYNKNKPEQYKNKELLVQCISEGYQNSPEDVKTAIEQSM